MMDAVREDLPLLAILLKPSVHPSRPSEPA